MTSGILIGIDSGGTRTNMVVASVGADEEPRQYEVGHALSGALPPSEYQRTLHRIFAPLESFWQDSGLGREEAHVFISAAGFAPSVREDFTDAVNDVVPQFLNGSVAAVGVANDAVSLVMGHDANGIVIAGTGSNVVIRTHEGGLSQIGGHEWVACDYGSGFWIGLRAIRQSYRDLEEGDETVLLQRLRQVYGIRSDDNRRLIAKLRDLAVADEDMKREIARFAAAVCGAAERGDRDAQNIVKFEAEDLADVMAGALRRKFSHEHIAEGLRLVQCGSLLTNDFYRRAFEAQLEMRLRSGSEQQAKLDWQRVTTGTQASLNLAGRLRGNTDALVRLPLAFRPLIMRF